MSSRNRWWARRAAALAFVAVAAGCGTPPRQAPEGSVSIRPVERVAWNREPEDRLFRVSFDERRTRQIAFRLGQAQFPAGENPFDNEVREMEEEAGRELRDKGLCPGSAQMAAPMIREAAGGVSAIFKCVQPVF
jgi:hypothetical protein